MVGGKRDVGRVGREKRSEKKDNVETLDNLLLA